MESENSFYNSRSTEKSTETCRITNDSEYQTGGSLNAFVKLLRLDGTPSHGASDFCSMRGPHCQTKADQRDSVTPSSAPPCAGKFSAAPAGEKAVARVCRHDKTADLQLPRPADKQFRHFAPLCRRSQRCRRAAAL